MVRIFKDGYLLPEYINPNYRGLVGFSVEGKNWKIARLGMVHGDRCLITLGGSLIERWKREIKIHAFTPADIPEGELCWVKEYYREMGATQTCNYKWVLKPKADGRYFCVPYLIAENEEQAEERKGWAE